MSKLNQSYYSQSELIQIAENCNSINELSEASKALKFLHETCEENVFLSGFNILAHFKIRQLLKISKKP